MWNLCLFRFFSLVPSGLQEGLVSVALLPRDQVIMKEEKPRVLFHQHTHSCLSPTLEGSPNHSPVLTALTWLNETLASHPHPRFLHPAAVDFPWECPALLEGPETLRVSQPCAQTFPQATTAQPAHPAPGLEDLVARGLALSS